MLGIGTGSVQTHRIGTIYLDRFNYQRVLYHSQTPLRLVAYRNARETISRTSPLLVNTFCSPKVDLLTVYYNRYGFEIILPSCSTFRSE